MPAVSKPHPTGPAWPIDDDWKQMIMERMAELGINKTDLAKKIGVTKQAMTALFAPKIKQTRLLPLVHKALKLPVPPSPGFSTHNAESIEANFALLSDADKEIVRNLINSLTSKPKT